MDIHPSTSGLAGATVVFDLDGTMIHTAPDLVRATNHVMAQSGLPPAPAEVITPAVGGGARAMITAALHAAGRPPDQVEIEPLLDTFSQFYMSNIAEESHPFPGLIDALDFFAASRVFMGVCTNKRHANATLLLETLQLDGYFGAIVGADALEVRKPHPEHLLETIRRSGGDPARAVMVGDSRPDIEVARAAGVPAIAVPHGYSPEPVESLAPDRIVDDLSALPEAVMALLADLGPR
ncbi:HAD family hydrolase [Dichotomicrobium thermohalophilum]|uniref:Phosphoglycolate phosphatase n=1 Tax=Dichotomicrobium thermohalophilum TaxID=933063 RepID=A0A397PDJ4_9HYPH|nr:HAD family hydrolase [Dichotomicrobium thermohalophilum]RIA47566.1 phosphoglycolate phosphatase [Dichotomicrobium thermohalophilum]